MAKHRYEHTPQQVKHFQSAVGQLSAGYRNNNPPESHYASHPIPHEQKLAAHVFPEERYEHLRSKTENWSRAIFDKDDDDTTRDGVDEGDSTNGKETISSGSTHTVESTQLNVFITEDELSVESLEDEGVTKSSSVKRQTGRTVRVCGNNPRILLQIQQP